jgi:putative peptidoglycan lipid II flippase
MLKGLFSQLSYRKGMGLSAVFTVVSKAVGYTRHLLVAYFFGISRPLDIYFMAYGITMMLIQPSTAWFDQITIPHLIRTREQEGPQASGELATSILSVSLGMSLIVSLLYALLLPLAIWLLAHGFSSSERIVLHRFGFYFVPWILVIYPYSALMAFFKSLRHYGVALVGDFTVSVIGTAGFAMWHRHLSALPLSLAAGYAVVIVGLLIFGRHHLSLTSLFVKKRIKPILKNFAEMFINNQTGTINSGVVRILQSYLKSGSLAAYSFTAQILAPIYELLSFDEFYIVPLSSLEQRQYKLNRLLLGIILLTTPLGIFLIYKAPVVVQLLFQRGKFDASATSLTAVLLQISTLAVIVGTPQLPLNRMLVITNRVLYNSFIVLGMAVIYALLGYLFVFHLKWDVQGFALATVGANIYETVALVYLVSRIGLHLNGWQLLKYASWGTLAGGLGVAAMRILPGTGTHIIDLGLAALVYGIVVTAFYWPVRSNIRFILYG